MKLLHKQKIRVFEGFAGYGGASFGLKRLKENLPFIDYEVVGYSEFDKFASSLFDANHRGKDNGPLKNWGDIYRAQNETYKEVGCEKRRKALPVKELCVMAASGHAKRNVYMGLHSV